MTVKQQRDSNGRFTGSKKKPENPDCEPATKGYVKRLIRNTRDHNHLQDSCYSFTTAIAITGMCLSLIGFLVIAGIVNPLEDAPAVWIVNNLGAIVAFTIPCIFFTIDMWRMDCESTHYVNQDEPTILQKYNPPPCEKKDECE